MRGLASLAAIAALSMAGAAAVAQSEVPAAVAAAVADADRPAADQARDAARKPAEIVAFAGVKPGDKVAEFLPGGGYYTRILAKAVQVHLHATKREVNHRRGPLYALDHAGGDGGEKEFRRIEGIHAALDVGVERQHSILGRGLAAMSVNPSRLYTVFKHVT